MAVSTPPRTDTRPPEIACKAGHAQDPLPVNHAPSVCKADGRVAPGGLVASRCTPIVGLEMSVLCVGERPAVSMRSRCSIED